MYSELLQAIGILTASLTGLVVLLAATRWAVASPVLVRLGALIALVAQLVDLLKQLQLIEDKDLDHDPDGDPDEEDEESFESGGASA